MYNSPNFPHNNRTSYDMKTISESKMKYAENNESNRRNITNMRATGIVRRIDDLGRVVIPKEIRRTMRIRESDPLEIFTDKEGEIILKKYSPIGEMSSFAKQYVDSLAQVSGHGAMIADRDQFIAVSGGYKNYLGKYISRSLEEKINNRESILAAKGDRSFISICDDQSDDYVSQAICPIICGGDIIGAVILVGNDSKSKMGEVEQKLVMSAAGFLGRQMEQ